MLKFRNQHNQRVLIPDHQTQPLFQDHNLQEPVWNNLQIYQGQQTLLEHLCQELEVTALKSESWEPLALWQTQLSKLITGLQSQPPLLQVLDLERYGFTAEETLEVLQDIHALCKSALQAKATEVRMDLNDLGDLDSEI